MSTVDYFDTLIVIAEDSPVQVGTVPPENAERQTVAARTFRMIADHPYEFTSADVIFTVFADRHDIPEKDRSARREDFYRKGQACLRSSDLAKKYGWGIHSDTAGRVALYGAESSEYQDFVEGKTRTSSGEVVTVIRAMRSRRK